MTAKMNGLICLAACLAAPLSALVARAGTTEPLTPAPTPALLAPAEVLSMFDEHAISPELLRKAMVTRPGALADMPSEPCELFAQSEASLETAGKMAEQVEAWTRWLASWGADRAVQYAVPGEADIAMCRKAAHSIAWLGTRSMGMLSVAIEASDRAGVGNDQVILDSVHLRETVLPLRTARALVLQAALTGDDAQRRTLGEQAQAMVEHVPASGPWSEIERSMVLALSWLARGETDEAVKHLAAAHTASIDPATPDAVRRVMGDEIALGGVLATLRAQGPAMARTVLEKIRDTTPFASDGQRDPHLALLAAGCGLRLARAEAAATADSQARLAIMEKAYKGFADLAERTDTGLPAVDVRRLVYAGLGPIVPSDAPLGVLPPIVSIAKARCLAEAHDRDGAMAILEPLLRRPSDELGSTETDAMWLTAALLTSENTSAERRRAADLFVRLSQEFPSDAQAPQALEAAASSAFKLSEEVATASPEARERAREFLIECLRLVHTSEAEVARRNAWRVELCRQLTAEPNVLDARLSLRRMDEARSVASSIPADSIDRANASYVVASGWCTILELATRRPEAFTAADMELTDIADAQLETAEAARMFIEASIRMPEGQNDESLQQALRSTTAFAAEALLLLNRPNDGLNLIMALPGATPSQEANARVARAAVHVLAELGGMSEARQWMDRLCDISPEWARWTLAEMSDRAWNQIEGDVLGFPADKTLDPSHDAAIPVLRLVEEMAHCRSLAESDMYKKRLAWALVLSGDGDQAARLFDTMMQSGGRQIDLLRGLGEARIASGNDAAAFTAFREVATLLEAQPHKDRNYWHAWTRMLQILARQNADGSRTETIAREVERLKALAADATARSYLLKIDQLATAVDAAE